MKILQLIPSLTDGGAERFVVDLCNELTVQNEVLLCTMFPLNNSSGFFKNELLPTIRLTTLDKKLGIDISIFKKLQKVINEFKPDIIHTHIRALNYLLPLLLFPGKSCKVVHTVHNDAWKETIDAKERKFRYWFYRRKKVMPITISKDSERTFKEAYPGVVSKVITNGTRMLLPSTQFNDVKNFIDSSKRNCDTKVFIHIGRLTAQKNHIMLISAFQRLINQGANALLLMIGGERNTLESEEIAAKVKAGCNNSIIWLGGNQPAGDYLMIAEFFCLSSIYEGMPISLIEALAVGCIPVCTPVGGIKEMIQDVGFLSKDTSEDAYYEAIEAAYKSSEDDLSRLKKRSKEVYKNRYDIKICAENYMHLYKKIAKKNQ